MRPVKCSSKTNMSGKVFRLNTSLVALPPRRCRAPCIDILELPLLQGDVPCLSSEHPLAQPMASEGYRDQSLRGTALGYPRPGGASGVGSRALSPLLDWLPRCLWGTWGCVAAGHFSLDPAGSTGANRNPQSEGPTRPQLPRL